MLKIAFTDFWPGFDIYDNFILDALKGFSNVEVIDVESEANRTKEVQIVFYSVFSYEFLEFDCIRIFFSGENVSPDFNLCDYAIGTDPIEFGDRYHRFPLYVANYVSDCEKMLSRREDNTSLDIRDKFCAMVVSNGSCNHPYRDELFYKLCDYKQVDSGGRYLNNINKPEGVDDKEEFLSNYKFSIACENSSHPGYCSEKIVQAFAAGTIPIYWGDPEIVKYFNEKAFVNCNKFNSLDEVVSYVKELDTDDKKYLEMLNEKAILDEEQLPEAYRKAFAEWLNHIVSNPESASRRNPYGRAPLYEAEVKDILNRAKLYDYEHQQMSLLELVKNRIKENRAK